MKNRSTLIPLALAITIAAPFSAAPAATQYAANQAQSNGQDDTFSSFLGSIFGNQQSADQTLDNNWNQGERPFAQRRQQVEARISESLASGAIDRDDAETVRRQYESMVDAEERYAANGGITTAERNDLRARYRAMIDQVNDSREYQRNAYQSIANQRAAFDSRINQALQQRRISSAQAQQLRRDYQGLAQLETSYRRNGLDKRERADIDARFDGLERRLNDSGFGNNANSARWSQLQTRIAASERNGSLSRRDAVQLRSEIGDLSRLDTAYAANGLNSSERAYLVRRYTETEARIDDNRRCRAASDVEVGDVERVFLDEFAARFDDIAHQPGEDRVGRVGFAFVDPQERAGNGVERRFPQLLGVHFAKALVALDAQPLAPGIEDGGEQVGRAGDAAVADLRLTAIAGGFLCRQCVEARGFRGAEEAGIDDMMVGNAAPVALEDKAALCTRFAAPHGLVGIGRGQPGSGGRCSGAGGSTRQARLQPTIQSQCLDDMRRVPFGHIIHQRPHLPRMVDYGAQVIVGARPGIGFQDCPGKPGIDQIILKPLIVLQIDFGPAARHFLQRRLGDIEVPGADQFRHLAIEEGQ